MTTDLTPQPPLRRGEGEPTTRRALLPLSAPERGLGGEGPLVDPAALASFFATVSELEGSLPILSIDRIGGGQSNVTCRVKLADRDVIVRRPPPGPLPPRAHDVLREHRILSALAPAGTVPVPRPIAACDDPAVLGAPFFVMEALPG